MKTQEDATKIKIFTQPGGGINQEVGVIVYRNDDGDEMDAISRHPATIRSIRQIWQAWQNGKSPSFSFGVDASGDITSLNIEASKP